jgi:UDP-N-acetylmuramoyl-L-alanyl-D-glutamate--2,6-diaminopimelate ligase
VQLDALIRALAPTEVTGARPVEIEDLAYDTRKVAHGALFFCVPGARTDGHDLAWEAIERGAAALVVERQLDVSVPQLVVPSMRDRGRRVLR